MNYGMKESGGTIEMGWVGEAGLCVGHHRPESRGPGYPEAPEVGWGC